MTTMSPPLDSKLCNELAEHVETLTHSGQKTLDAQILKKIKLICKSSDGYVEQIYHLLRHQLEKDHAEIRFSAFQIVDEIFRRSHCFRELLVSDMQRIIELTTGTSPEHLLPPPKPVADNLKRLSLRCIHEWNAKYGEGYKKLQLGYNFLKKCKKVDFNTLEVESAAEQAQRQERQRRQNLINQEKLKKTLAEYEESQSEMKDAITAMENCVSLLIPSLDDFFITEEKVAEDIGAELGSSNVKADHLEQGDSDSDEENSDGEPDSYIREHGMLNPNFSVKVEVNSGVKVKETPENAAVFDNVRDLNRLILRRYIPTVKSWIKIITKCGANSEDLRKMVDLKEALEKAIVKCNNLKMCIRSGNASDTSDSDFEDVPEKEGYEEKVCEPLPSTSAGPVSKTGKSSVFKEEWNIYSKENHEKDPTSLRSTLENLLPKMPASTDQISDKCLNHFEKDVKTPTTAECDPVPSTSKEEPVIPNRKQKLLAVAPKLPFDVDLYHWEDEELEAPKMLLVKPDGARFWSATSVDEIDEIEVPEGAASLRTRVIEFSGKDEPVKWACRAPLPSGKLCPRRDRYKCPFHGPIVPRDEMGKCTNPEDEMRIKEALEEEQRKNPDWQDPKLLEELKEATGLDLKMPEKGKRKKKKKESKKFPGLTDIKAKQNNTYTRLAKKVFNRNTMKRVAQRLDRLDHKRFRDKFGDQFNYVHDTS